MIAGSLFSGIGGFDLGFRRAGIATAYQVEIDPKCGEVLARHFPECERHTDVREFGAIPRVDVVFGGFPCQDLSVAGRRAGLDGARSGLWREFFRVLAVALPRFCVIENVPGLLSSRRGRDFELLLQDLEQLGYRVAWRTLDAQHFGLAQRRKRVFIVGSLGDGSSAEVLFEPASLRRDSAPRREARPDIAGCLGGGAPGRGRRDNPDSSGAFVPDVGFTVSPARGTGDGHGQGWNSNYVSHGAIARPVTATSYKGHDEDTDTLIAETLHQHPRPGSNSNGAIVADPIGANEARTYANAGNNPRPHNVIAFDTTQITSGENRCNPQAGDPCHPLSAAAHAPSVVGRGVRRLTPRECERLQGFPDDWTAGFADSHRYRMLGNAVAVPVAEWIACRLLRVLNRPAPPVSVEESPAVRASAGDDVGKPAPTTAQGGAA